MKYYSPPFSALKPYDRRFIIRMAVALGLALVVITILQIASYLILKRQIASEADTSALINLSGMQRMKSQRIALLSMALLNVASEAMREKTSKALLAEATGLARIHSILAHGDDQLGISKRHSPQLNAIFVGEHALNQKVAQFINAVASLAQFESKQLTAQNPLIIQVTESSSELLELFKKLTDHYRNEGDQGIADLHRLAKRALQSTFVVVALVICFIFYPIIRRLKIELFERSKVQSELIEQNNELEQFAAIVAHDLKAPLNNIGGFGQFLKSKLEDKDDKEAIVIIQQIEVGVLRMNQMITELLNYARLSQNSRTFERVDLNTLLTSVLKDFQVAIEEISAQISVSPLPDVKGNSVQLKHLFHNLISNALKYAVKERSACVAIFADDNRQLEGNFVNICIQDNGRGFPPGSLERMFQPFKRLISAGDTEGAGFGLALCKKIVNRHHGSIRAENIPEGGARFWVTLPAA